MEYCVDSPELIVRMLWGLLGLPWLGARLDEEHFVGCECEWY